MPDDAKDLGAQLLSKELNGYDVTPDVEKWLFKLVKKEEPKPDDDAKPNDKDPKPDGKTKSNQ